MNFKIEYSVIQDNIQVDGYSVSKTDCSAYFSNQVSSKIDRADSTEQLCNHIAELRTTGFEVGTLFAQTETTPQIKDWEIGEAFAEAVLEDEHDAMFPWETGWDKRTSKASLPGADIVGLQNKAAPRFIFGQVKSSSEERVPPQIVNSGKDCLKKQMHRLRHSNAEQRQLIQWLLLRMKGTNWEKSFNEALGKYVQKDYCLVGVLVSGGRKAEKSDLSGICADIQHAVGDGEMTLLGYYLPFMKHEWPGLVQRKEVSL